MINTVTLVGRLVRMPEIRTTNAQKKVATMTLAVERNYKNQKGEKDTDFIPVILWRSVDFVEKYIGKGDMVAVRGMIQVRSYEKDGQRRTATEVLAEEIQLCMKAGKKEDPKPQGMEEFEELPELDLPF